MRFYVSLLSIFIVLASAAITNAQAVLFTGTGNHYELIRDSVTWEEAETAAATRSLFGVAGHLATLTTAEENDFLLNTFGGDSGWIGFFQPPGSIEPDQGFRWVTDEPTTFTNFGGAEPNNVGGDEDFVEFFNGNWNDLGPTAGRRYYVEFETATVVPEPSGAAFLLIVFSYFLIRRKPPLNLVVNS